MTDLIAGVRESLTEPPHHSSTVLPGPRSFHEPSAPAGSPPGSAPRTLPEPLFPHPEGVSQPSGPFSKDGAHPGSPWTGFPEETGAPRPSSLDFLEGSGASAGPRNLSPNPPEGETSGEVEEGATGPSRRPASESSEEPGRGKSPRRLTGTACCLRCAKQLPKEGVFCSRPNATAKCHRCSAIHNKCPPKFRPRVAQLQELADNVARGLAEPSKLAHDGGKFVAEVESFVRRMTPKKGKPAVVAPAAPDIGAQLQRISTQLSQLTELLAAHISVYLVFPLHITTTGSFKQKRTESSDLKNIDLPVKCHNYGSACRRPSNKLFSPN
ncbi:hypothetical protein AJ79_04625 [Helicocarpus griseus UAMH5409]|uniref:Uncharacterized protein n=1 Tax=Helicocarpus griseus UAMH5409 TaxID=1447875 RepID=A0A2B7XTB7_9EURO|nr:hypothetical protein AJ79_04625 [Helicocarpus griseus UAMH5409]